jgi:2-C-methyl-D-erythritol 4-phosphate cytidylyltransferase
LSSDFFPKQRFWAVVPAAGGGSRFGADCPKQYVGLLGFPLIRHTLETLRKCSLEAIVVAISEDDSYWSVVYQEVPNDLVVTRGGLTRADSVLQGLLAIQDRAAVDDWVLVHDAARPCVRARDIERLMTACHEHPVGGLLGVPVRDTLKRTDASQNVVATVDRHMTWQAQTPQMFRFGVLLEALQRAMKDSLLITDEASAIEALGLKPKMVVGDIHNIKVTYPEDLALAARFLQQEQ